jgi:hypothetical protein
MTRLCRLGATEGDLSHASAAKLLTKDDARRIAVNIAKLPSLLSRPSSIGIRERISTSIDVRFRG